MNWEAVGAVGEILGAVAVVLTLVYLAIQVRYARKATVDQNLLTRSTAIREMILAAVGNDELRDGQMSNWGMDAYYDALGRELGVSRTEASRNEWANAYYFWMYWGQWVATHDPKDLKELEHVISALLRLPGVRHSWEKSPLVRPLFDEAFVDFVDGILAKAAA